MSDQMTARAGAPRRPSGAPRRYQMYIGGQWVDARSGETFESVDPFTGRTWALVPRAGAADVDDAVGAARRAFDDGPWRRTTAVQRGRLMRRLASLIGERAREVAIVESTDNGKLLREMEQQLAGLPDLGGKSPNIVFADADLEAATNGIVAGVYAATGQTCMAGSRLLIADEVYDELVERVAERARQVRLGDPLDPRTEMGPVAFRTHLERVLAFVTDAEQEGATLVSGGRRPSSTGLEDGFFVEPTLLRDVHNGMRISREEVFGPVAAAIRFGDEAHALSLANDTQYGLAAGIWTKDVQRAHRMAHGIRAGTVWINSYRAVGPMAPFGGFKASGLGRENGLESLYEYTESKTVWVELSGASRDPFKLG